MSVAATEKVTLEGRPAEKASVLLLTVAAYHLIIGYAILRAAGRSS